MAKIVSRRGRKEDEVIEPATSEQPDSDVFTVPVEPPSDEPIFEYYNEDWVIQYAAKLGYKVYYLVNDETWAFISDQCSFSLPEVFIQSEPEIVKAKLHDTIQSKNLSTTQ